MQTNADRNLLLGILALQMDFISREQLITAMNAWVLEKLSAEQMQRRRQYIADAVATLKQAITAGWDDFAHIQRDPDLNILRELPEFKAILPQPIESDSKSDSDSADGKAKATGKQSTDAQKGSD